MERWVGRVALVTGASSGIGAAVCRELVRNGLKVVGCARSIDRIQKLATEPQMKCCKGSLYPVKCDLTKESDILSMFDLIRNKLGRLDVCVNNAGYNADCPLTSGKTEAWRSMFEVNVLALCICTRESIKLMNEKNVKDGQIINLSSVAGHVVLDLMGSFYCGTKFMVSALTEGLRQELRSAKSKIRVSSISPGMVETEFLTRMTQGDKEAEKAVLDAVGPIKPLEAKDIASAVITILQAPPHVEINNILIRPTEQDV